MKVRFLLLGAASVAGIAVSACGGASNNGGGTPGGGVQGVQSGAIGTSTTSLGTFLIGPDNKTLYLFEADTGPMSTCTADCAAAWPPLLVSGAPVAGPGVMASLLTTTTRSSGLLQVVYNGHPLYYYASDTKPGDTNGEGVTNFGAGWDVVSPAGNKIEKP
jgi:predicted lipoprotein with Yx(FWY)xxD motif